MSTKGSSRPDGSPCSCTVYTTSHEESSATKGPPSIFTHPSDHLAQGGGMAWPGWQWQAAQGPGIWDGAGDQLTDRERTRTNCLPTLFTFTLQSARRRGGPVALGPSLSHLPSLLPLSPFLPTATKRTRENAHFDLRRNGKSICLVQAQVLITQLLIFKMTIWTIGIALLHS